MVAGKVVSLPLTYLRIHELLACCSKVGFSGHHASKVHWDGTLACMTPVWTANSITAFEEIEQSSYVAQQLPLCLGPSYDGVSTW